MRELIAVATILVYLATLKKQTWRAAFWAPPLTIRVLYAAIARELVRGQLISRIFK